MAGTLLHEIAHELGPEFARVKGKQVDINEAIETMLKLLRRLIGEAGKLGSVGKGSASLAYGVRGEKAKAAEVETKQRNIVIGH